MNVVGGGGYQLSDAEYDRLHSNDINVIADTALCPEPQAIIDRFVPEFDQLLTVTLMLPWGEH